MTVYGGRDLGLEQEKKHTKILNTKYEIKIRKLKGRKSFQYNTQR